MLEAVKQLSAPPPVYLLETRAYITTNPLAVHFYAAIPTAERYDANTILVSTGQPAWNAAIEDMQHHPSQFNGEWIAAVQNAPASDRAVFLGPAAAMLQQQVEPCFGDTEPSNFGVKLARPGFEPALKRLGSN